MKKQKELRTYVLATFLIILSLGLIVLTSMYFILLAIPISVVMTILYKKYWQDTMLTLLVAPLVFVSYLFALFKIINYVDQRRTVNFRYFVFTIIAITFIISMLLFLKGIISGYIICCLLLVVPIYFSAGMIRLYSTTPTHTDSYTVVDHYIQQGTRGGLHYKVTLLEEGNYTKYNCSRKKYEQIDLYDTVTVNQYDGPFGISWYELSPKKP